MTTTPTSGAADLRTAAQAVVDRWDTPLWKDVPATAEYIGRLRAALAAGQATAAQQGAAYAALPEPYCNAHDDADACYPDMFSEYQMRAFADATHAIRASHGQAPASVLHLVNSAFAEIAMAFPKAFALHKVGIADKAVLEALAAPAGAQADSVLEDAARYRWLRERSSTMFVNVSINGGGAEIAETLDLAVDAARKQGEKQ